MANCKAGCNGQSKAVKVQCPHCAHGGKKNWHIAQVTMALVGGGTLVTFIWTCAKCGLSLLHTPFGW